MKRSEALQPLSRDHHRALEVALKLRRVTEADAAPAAADFLTYWRGHGAHHFRIEEEVMLPGAAHRVDPNDLAVARVLTEHVEIRRRADAVADGSAAGVAELNALGEMLNEHVRHEEQVLFPLLEEHLPADELNQLAQKIDEARHWRSSAGGKAIGLPPWRRCRP